MNRIYPVGIQSFREIRESGNVYVDKTEQIHDLIRTGKYFFLSRPSRFGKSLLLDTIEEIFNGAKGLFQGLWIEKKWNWDKKNPVIRLDVEKLAYEKLGLEEALFREIHKNANRFSIEIKSDNIKEAFEELIEKVAQIEKVVILIDEYDKSIIDYVEEPEIWAKNQAILKIFYSVIKGSDRYIRFFLMTGITQANNLDIYSGLNNLDNITLSNQFGDLVGITQKELEVNFAEEISELSLTIPDILEQLKMWYNGYTWNMKSWVYNPFSLLKYMRDRKMVNHWELTGIPSFLLKHLKNKMILNLEGVKQSGEELAFFDSNSEDLTSILFQTGFLTIKDVYVEDDLYVLGYPNMEVEKILEMNAFCEI